jgi:hypothetical protein
MEVRSQREHGLKGVAAVGAAGVALALGLLAPAAVQAEERVCRGALGAVTVDNLLVTQDATCNLNGTRVQGTAQVQRNATLNANGIRVIGNVQGENARHVAVRSSGGRQRPARAGALGDGD